MTRGLVALAVTAAAGLRLYTLASPAGGLDADEAVVGLMTIAALQGDLPTFFWGQAYGGTHEVVLTAPVVEVLGSSAATVRAVPIALFALACLLLWRVGRRTIGEPAATAAAVIFALGPAYFVWQSTRAHGFYGSMLVLSMLVLLLALRVDETRARSDAVALGLAAGLAWWAGPLTATVIVPTLAWLVARRGVRPLWPAVPAAAAGAAPWLVWNGRHGFASLRAASGSIGGEYADSLETFAAATLPTALGLRVPFTLEWLVPELLVRVVTVATLLLLASLLFRGGGRTLLGLVAVAYPFLHGLSPNAGLTTEPRYLVLLAPLVALALADVAARTPARAAAVALVVGALSFVGLREIGQQRPAVPPVGGVRVPHDLGPALDVLDRAGVRRVRAHYAIAYRITFESGERIVAASTGQSRRAEYQSLVARSTRPGFVFVRGSRGDRTFVRPGYRRVATGGWAVFVPPTR